MADLTERIEEIGREIVIRDTVRLIDEEVAAKSGVTGMALKGGYKVVKKLRNGRMIERAVDHLLDDFSGAMNPFYTDFCDSDGDSFERYLGSHLDEAADALLGITDRRINEAENKIIVKTYGKLRGQAKKHVIEALPGVGRLIDSHAN